MVHVKEYHQGYVRFYQNKIYPVTCHHTTFLYTLQVLFIFIFFCNVRKPWGFYFSFCVQTKSKFTTLHACTTRQINWYWNVAWLSNILTFLKIANGGRAHYLNLLFCCYDFLLPVIVLIYICKFKKISFVTQFSSNQYIVRSKPSAT